MSKQRKMSLFSYISETGNIVSILSYALSGFQHGETTYRQQDILLLIVI